MATTSVSRPSPTPFPEGNAIVYCEGAYSGTNGKTAHGLVRRTKRYRILSVVDSTISGQDAGDVLDGVHRAIPIEASVADAVGAAKQRGKQATHLVVGVAPDGGRLPAAAHAHLKAALEAGLNIDCGLHDFLSEDPELSAIAVARGVVIRDVRKPPARSDLHFFSGKITQVGALKVALLGTDSAVGKRTTAWQLVDALEQARWRASLVGTGQTSWMQGCHPCIILDSLVNDFVAGEIEHAVWAAWDEQRPDVIVIEGQGSLLNPAYPGGFEILAAARPDAVILQHAPARREYDGFPGYPIQSLSRQIEAVEVISGRPVVAVTINRENLRRPDIPKVCAQLSTRIGLPVCDPLDDSLHSLVPVLERIRQQKSRRHQLH